MGISLPTFSIELYSLLLRVDELTTKVGNTLSKRLPKKMKARYFPVHSADYAKVGAGG